MRCLNSHSPSTAQNSGTSRAISGPVTLTTFWLQVWEKGYFKRTTLEKLGLVVNLGHSGGHCPSPAEPQRILVVDLSGHHTVRTCFCNCSQNGPPENYQQLLRVGWYPASVLRPQTAFTFDLLDTHEKISLQGKLNLYDFYNAIMQKTDNHGGSKLKVSDFNCRSSMVANFRPKVPVP